MIRLTWNILTLFCVLLMLLSAASWTAVAAGWLQFGWPRSDAYGIQLDDGIRLNRKSRIPAPVFAPESNRKSEQTFTDDSGRTWDDEPNPDYILWRFNAGNKDWSWNHVGIYIARHADFEYIGNREAHVGSRYYLIIPYWLVLLLAGIIPACRGATALHARRTARRRSNNLCKNCGYDLRATPQRCPECGLVPSQ